MLDMVVCLNICFCEDLTDIISNTNSVDFVCGHQTTVTVYMRDQV